MPIRHAQQQNHTMVQNPLGMICRRGIPAIPVTIGYQTPYSKNSWHTLGDHKSECIQHLQPPYRHDCIRPWPMLVRRHLLLRLVPEDKNRGNRLFNDEKLGVPLDDSVFIYSIVHQTHKWGEPPPKNHIRHVLIRVPNTIYHSRFLIRA